MVAPSPGFHVPSALLLACLGSHATRAQLRLGVEGLRALARQEHALELRLAMDLAWLKQQDPADLGYPSFHSLCRENVDWARSWTLALVRLVQSPLDLVKRAACEGVIPMRLAVRAPGRIAAEDQEAWLVAATLDPLDLRERRHLEGFEGEDAVAIRKARSLARLLVGREASPREVDDFILAAWRERTPAEALLEAARTPPPPPPPLEPLDASWCEEPWSEPSSPKEALGRVEETQAILRGRRVVLARSWAWISNQGIWACAGFESAEQLANEVLGVSLRTAQRMAKAGWALEWYPELEEAVRVGLPFGVAHELAPVLDPRSVGHWIDIAARVGRRELGLAVEEARQPRSETCTRYREAIVAADAWWSTRPEAQTTSAGRLSVALPHAEPEVPRATPVRAPAELPEAARWLLEHVHIEPHRGFAAVKTRDDHRCQNPECGRRSLCNQAHHLVFRSEGGSDAPENALTVCRPCHLRGLHTGRIRVERVVVAGREALLWSYPGRHVLKFGSPP